MKVVGFVNIRSMSREEKHKCSLASRDNNSTGGNHSSYATDVCFAIGQNRSSCNLAIHSLMEIVLCIIVVLRCL